jgi:hypothetical protein
VRGARTATDRIDRVLFTHIVGVALCVAAAFVPTRAGALELGRMFFTPEQRADMDRKRYAPPPAQFAAPTAPALPSSVEPSRAPSFVTLDGYVTRSSGHSTAWVNGQPQNDRVRVQADRVRVDDGTHRSIDLRVGETYERNSGQRQNLLENGGRVNVQR